MLAIAPRMSSTRSRQSLGGNNGLAEDSVAELGLQGCRRNEIHAMADQLTELSLKAHELKEADWTVEFDEQSTSLSSPPSSRAKEPNRDSRATPKASKTDRLSRNIFRMSSRPLEAWTAMALIIAEAADGRNSAILSEDEGEGGHAESAPPCDGYAVAAAA